MSVSLAKLAVGTVAAIAAVTAVGSAVPAVAAAPPGTFEVDYDVSGSTYVAASKNSVALGPATLTSYVSDSGDGTFTGSLPLPPAQGGFSIGSIKTYATINYIPVGQVTGKLSDTTPTTVTSTAKYTIKLTNAYALIANHKIPTNVGNNCKTVSPAVITSATPKGQSFDLTTGGTLKGTYTIPRFANCNGLEFLISQNVSGPNNTVTLNVSNGRFQN